MNAKIDNKIVTLNQSDMIDVGGEAMIFKLNTKAIKIYKNPDHKRISKLSYILSLKKQVPKEFCYPEKLVYNDKNNIIGFLMNRIPKSYQVFEELTKRRFQETRGHNLKTVTELFIKLYNLVNQIHSINIFIGDFNDRNLLFKDTDISFIDTDSYQIDNYPCPVATETYLDPFLYDIVLADKPCFSNLTDWYSWFVMFIKTTLFIHPYGGMNAKCQRLLDRAKNRITFLDENVIIPKFALKPEILSNDILSLFDQVFKKNKRIVPDKNIFVELFDSSVICHSCKVGYWGNRKSCPNCSVKNIEIINKKPSVISSNIKYTQLFVSIDNILSHRILGSDLFFAVSNNKKGSIFKLNLNNGFVDIFVNHDKIIDDFDIYNDICVLSSFFYDKLDIKSRIVSRNILTGNYKQKPVFGISNNKVFYIYGGQIYSLNLLDMNKEILDQCCEDQTWFQTHKDYIFGFQRIFGVYDFFLYKVNKISKWSLKFVEVNENESLLECNSYLNGDKLLILAKIEKSRKINTKVYCVSINDPTKILFSFESCSLMHDIYKTIKGKSFFCGKELIVLHPSDNGIVQHVFDGQSHKFTSFAGSEQFVSSNDSIAPFGRGILVVSEKEIGLLDIS